MAETELPHDPLFNEEDDSVKERPPTPIRNSGNPTIARPAVQSGRNAGRPPKPEPEVVHADPDTVQRVFSSIFNFAARILRSDSEFTDAEFKPLSIALVDISKRFRMLAIILVALTPLIALSELADKIIKLRQGIRPKNPNQPRPEDMMRPFPEQARAN